VPLFRTPAVVLRARDLGEHDRLVSLYSRDLGRLTAVARGARRLRSRFGGALELFTWGEAVGFEREGRDLLRLDHFDIHRSFRRLREDLERLGHGARVIEAIFRLTAERDPQPAAFALLTRALRALEGERPARVQLAFALRFLDLTGHRPRLDRCAGCGRAVGTAGIAFDAGEGGVRCAVCRSPDSTLVSARALGALRGLQAAPWDARLEARIPAPVEAEASSVLDGYLAALSGSALRTPRFLARTLGPAESP
jgi:DNA repair protein RecO (recombination protein O)